MRGRPLETLLSLLYPQECHVCSAEVVGHDGGVACRECWGAVRALTGGEMLCERCGAVLGEKSAPIPVYCRQCDDHYYDRATAAAIYEGAVAACIVRLKQVRHFPNRLDKLIRGAVPRLGRLPVDLIVPVPLSAERRAERGFNQAEVVSHFVSRATGTPVDCHTLARTRNTPMHRTGMDRRARELTVQEAFRVVRPQLVAARSILLVDDVLTSGATASACARALKRSGASQVHVFTLARAVI